MNKEHQRTMFFLAKSSVANWAIFQSAMFAEVFGYPLDGPKDDDHGGWMPTEALAAQKKKTPWR